MKDPDIRQNVRVIGHGISKPKPLGVERESDVHVVLAAVPGMRLGSDLSQDVERLSRYGWWHTAHVAKRLPVVPQIRFDFLASRANW
jgi:hypothetical protein